MPREKQGHAEAAVAPHNREYEPGLRDVRVAGRIMRSAITRACCGIGRFSSRGAAPESELVSLHREASTLVSVSCWRHLSWQQAAPAFALPRDAGGRATVMTSTRIPGKFVGFRR